MTTMNNEDQAEPMEPGEERDCRHGQPARGCDRRADGRGAAELVGEGGRGAGAGRKRGRDGGGAHHEGLGPGMWSRVDAVARLP